MLKFVLTSLLIGRLPKKIILATALLVFMLPGISFGQGRTRPDINSLSNSDLLWLIQTIDTWLTEDLIEHHQVDFSTIHSTRNFLRFHREHLFSLDNYIASQNHSTIPLMPMWDPSNPVPWYFNGWEPAIGTPTVTYMNISTQCSNCGTTSFTEDYTPYTPPTTGRPTNLQLPAMIGGVYPNTQLCGWTNAVDLSNEISAWHGGVHIALAFAGGGIMGSGRSPAAFIFWAWHAYVDQVWYDWDCGCAMKNGTTVVNANGTGAPAVVTTSYDYPTGLTLNSANTTPNGLMQWNTPGEANKIVVKGKIVIPKDLP